MGIGSRWCGRLDQVPRRCADWKLGPDGPGARPSQVGAAETAAEGGRAHWGRCPRRWCDWLRAGYGSVLPEPSWPRLGSAPGQGRRLGRGEGWGLTWGGEVFEDALEVVVGEEINDDAPALVVLVWEDGDAGGEGFAEAGFEVSDVGRLGA